MSQLKTTLLAAAAAIAVVTAMWYMDSIRMLHIWERGQTILAYEAIDANRANRLFADRGIPGRFQGGLLVGGAPVDYCDPLLEFWFERDLVYYRIVSYILAAACVGLLVFSIAGFLRRIR